MEFWPYALPGMGTDAGAILKMLQSYKYRFYEFNPKVGKGLRAAEPADLLAEHPVDGYDSQTDLMALRGHEPPKGCSPHRRHVYGTCRTSARDRNFLPEPTFMIAPTVQSKTGLASAPVEAPPRRKLLFASVHSILDFSNGASVATLDVLQGLTTLGFECQAFCTAKLDLAKEVGVEQMIGDLHEPYQLRQSVCGDDHARMLYTRGTMCRSPWSARNRPGTASRAWTRFARSCSSSRSSSKSTGPT